MLLTFTALKWNYSTGDVIASSPAVANDVVYVGSFDTKLYALDAGTGALKWTYPTGGGIGYYNPAVANGVVYIGSNDTKLYALDARTGIPKWSYTTGGDVGYSPAVVNGVIYEQFGNVMYAFHLPGMS